MNSKAKIVKQRQTRSQRLLAGASGLALVCLGCSPSLAQTYTVVHSFGTNVMGLNPQGSLAQAADGTLFGTTAGGGTANKGQVFRVRADGTDFTALWNFMGSDAEYPAGGLLLVGTNLYGTSGGTLDVGGTVFKLNIDGSGQQVLKSFEQSSGDGYSPGAELVVSGSTLYGITSRGGSNDCGTVFKVNVDGTGYAILKQFTGPEGREPRGGLVLSGTTLYGTTMQGGAADLGTIFKLNASDGTYTVLKEFHFSDGRYPLAPLALDGTTLYGTTSIGGSADHGTVFKINTDGSGFVTLKSYDTLAEGHFPWGRLVVSGSALYGTTFEGGSSNCGTVFTLNTHGSAFAVLKNLGGADGTEPKGGLVLNGSVLYGTTCNGGLYNNGTVFQVNIDGSGFSTLTNFVAGDGNSPGNGLTLVGSNLVGTTYGGGSSGRGSIFKVGTNGTGYVRLHDFDGSGWPTPQGLLAVDQNTLYGMTHYGGVSNCGTLFRLSGDGTAFTVLKEWSGGAEGSNPNSDLALLGQSLYGTTYGGGSSNCGTIFRINLDGTSWTALKSFAGADGAFPRGGLVASGGVLYGITANGGAQDRGTIFKLNADGSGYSLLKEFDGGSEGGNPETALLLSGTTLYGTARNGGDSGCGTVFRVNLDGSGFAALKSFSWADGAGPSSPLVLSGQTLFGVTGGGGFYGNGTAFVLQTDGTGFAVLEHVDGTGGRNPVGPLVLLGETLYGATFGGGGLDEGVVFSLAPGPPTILSQPQDQTVDVDSTVDFQVDASGYPPAISYQWLFNGTIIEGATNSLLELTNVQWSQSGTYSVAVCNSYGCITSLVATLTVQEPVVVTQPADQVANSGDAAMFAVSALGTPPLVYQWFKDQQPLQDNARVVGARSSSLMISNVCLDDAGSYFVVVTNLHGTVTSWEANLYVNPPSYSILHTFAGGLVDGAGPFAGLALAGNTLFGTTEYGGSNGNGTIFRVNTDGSGYAVLHQFGSLYSTGTNYPNVGGAQPCARLVVADSCLYGTTYWGGAYGWGTVFKLNTDGSGFAVLKEFSGPDGANPTAGLAVSGTTLYGSTWQGGSTFYQPPYNSSGLGAVFRLNTDGNGFAVVRSFTGSDGAAPEAGLTLSGSTLYGVTRYGGNGGGTIFKVNTDGTAFSVVRYFSGGQGNSEATLALSGSILYGATGGGMLLDRSGTVFRLNVDGSDYNVLHSFITQPNCTAGPGTLSLAGDTLLGTTFYGGTFNAGTVFGLGTDGTGFVTLKHFSGGFDGANPSEVGGVGLAGAGLVFSEGKAYGTTSAGGLFGAGVIFSLSLAPVIQQPPQSQTTEIGATVALSAPADGPPTLGYQWFINTTNLVCASTNGLLRLTNVQPWQAGAYTVIITNAFGAVTSPPAVLGVIPPVQRRTVPALTLVGPPGASLHLENRDAMDNTGNWLALASVTLTNQRQLYFDLTTPLPPQGYYRAFQTNALSPPSVLDLHVVPAITLTGGIGGTVHVDYINQFGPIDAWVNLATVTLTNTTQLYFDTSAIGQPPRLWRIVPMP